jgi:hypothetical protein
MFGGESSNEMFFSKTLRAFTQADMKTIVGKMVKD